MGNDPYGGEEVLVVPTLLLHELGYFQGFTSETRPYLNTLLDPAHTLFLPRVLAENDPSYKQLIPYCLFRWEDQLFQYCRGQTGGESRLIGKRSVGVGGHICREDQGDGQERYESGMQRELTEEVTYAPPLSCVLWGLINDDSSPVGRVHLGIVHLFDLEKPKVDPLESSMSDSGFARVDLLKSDRADFETWSQLCLDSLPVRAREFSSS